MDFTVNNKGFCSIPMVQKLSAEAASTAFKASVHVDSQV